MTYCSVLEKEKKKEKKKKKKKSPREKVRPVGFYSNLFLSHNAW